MDNDLSCTSGSPNEKEPHTHNATEEPRIIKTDTTEEPLVIKTDTTKEPLIIKTDTTEESLLFKSNITEESLEIKTSVPEDPFLIKNNVAEDAPIIEKKITEEALINRNTIREETLINRHNTTEESLLFKSNITEESLEIKTSVPEDPFLIKNNVAEDAPIIEKKITEEALINRNTIREETLINRHNTTEELLTVVKDISEKPLDNVYNNMQTDNKNLCSNSEVNEDEMMICDNEAMNDKNDTCIDKTPQNSEGPKSPESCPMLNCKRKLSESKPNLISSKKRKKDFQPPPRLKDSSRDIFCWKCHKYVEDIVSCSNCIRVYHFKCCHLPEKPKNDWICPECDAIVKADEAISSNIPLKRLIEMNGLSRLLLYALNRMRHHDGSVHFEYEVDLNDYPDYKDYIIKPMCLKLLEFNINNDRYKNCEEFLCDAKWMVHNSYIFNTAHSELTLYARGMVKHAKNECDEIVNCPDCYRHANANADGQWFIMPCELPHILVWARLKGWPFWPCKVMKFTGNNVDVRFFGDHNKAVVPVDCCFLYSMQPPSKQKRYPDLERAIEECALHIELLVQKFVRFCFADHRIPLQPKKENDQRKSLLPLFGKELSSDEIRTIEVSKPVPKVNPGKCKVTVVKSSGAIQKVGSQSDISQQHWSNISRSHIRPPPPQVNASRVHNLINHVSTVNASSPTIIIHDDDDDDDDDEDDDDYDDDENDDDDDNHNYHQKWQLGSNARYVGIKPGSSGDGASLVIKSSESQGSRISDPSNTSKGHFLSSLNLARNSQVVRGVFDPSKERKYIVQRIVNGKTYYLCKQTDASGKLSVLNSGDTLPLNKNENSIRNIDVKKTSLPLGEEVSNVINYVNNNKSSIPSSKVSTEIGTSTPEDLNTVQATSPVSSPNKTTVHEKRHQSNKINKYTLNPDVYKYCKDPEIIKSLKPCTVVISKLTEREIKENTRKKDEGMDKNKEFQNKKQVSNDENIQNIKGICNNNTILDERLPKSTVTTIIEGTPSQMLDPFDLNGLLPDIELDPEYMEEDSDKEVEVEQIIIDPIGKDRAEIQGKAIGEDDKTGWIFNIYKSEEQNSSASKQISNAKKETTAEETSYTVSEDSCKAVDPPSPSSPVSETHEKHPDNVSMVQKMTIASDNASKVQRTISSSSEASILSSTLELSRNNNKNNSKLVQALIDRIMQKPLPSNSTINEAKFEQEFSIKKLPLIKVCKPTQNAKETSFNKPKKVLSVLKIKSSNFIDSVKKEIRMPKNIGNNVMLTSALDNIQNKHIVQEKVQDLEDFTSRGGLVSNEEFTTTAGIEMSKYLNLDSVQKINKEADLMVSETLQSPDLNKVGDVASNNETCFAVSDSLGESSVPAAIQTHKKIRKSCDDITLTSILGREKKMYNLNKIKSKTLLGRSNVTLNKKIPPKDSCFTILVNSSSNDDSEESQDQQFIHDQFFLSTGPNKFLVYGFKVGKGATRKLVDDESLNIEFSIKFAKLDTGITKIFPDSSGSYVRNIFRQKECIETDPLHIVDRDSDCEYSVNKVSPFPWSREKALFFDDDSGGTVISNIPLNGPSNEKYSDRIHSLSTELISDPEEEELNSRIMNCETDFSLMSKPASQIGNTQLLQSEDITGNDHGKITNEAKIQARKGDRAYIKTLKANLLPSRICQSEVNVAIAKLSRLCPDVLTENIIQQVMSELTESIKKRVQGIHKDLVEEMDAVLADEKKSITEKPKHTSTMIKKLIDETKSKKWCERCRREGQFWCCMPQVYCSRNCQIADWPNHEAHCLEYNKSPEAAAQLTPRGHLPKLKLLTKFKGIGGQKYENIGKAFTKPPSNAPLPLHPLASRKPVSFEDMMSQTNSKLRQGTLNKSSTFQNASFNTQPGSSIRTLSSSSLQSGSTTITMPSSTSMQSGSTTITIPSSNMQGKSAVCLPDDSSSYSGGTLRQLLNKGACDLKNNNKVVLTRVPMSKGSIAVSVNQPIPRKSLSTYTTAGNKQARIMLVGKNKFVLGKNVSSTPSTLKPVPFSSINALKKKVTDSFNNCNTSEIPASCPSTSKAPTKFIVYDKKTGLCYKDNFPCPNGDNTCSIVPSNEIQLLSQQDSNTCDNNT